MRAIGPPTVAVLSESAEGKVRFVVSSQLIVVAQLLTGALAALIVGRFFMRRRAYVAIVSVVPSARLGVRGEMVALEPAVREVLRRFKWSALDRPPLDREDLTVLNSTLRRARLFKRASGQALRELDASIADVGGGSLSRQSLKRAIERVLGVHVLGRMLMGMTARRVLVWPSPPADTSAVDWLIPLRDEPIGAGSEGVLGRVLLECSTHETILLRYDDPFDREAMLQLGHGLGNPDASAVRDNLRLVRDELLEDITIADSVIAELSPLLLMNSRWVVTAQIANVGTSPCVFAPSARVWARSGGRSYGPFDLRIRGESAHVNEEDEDESDPESDFNSFGVMLPPDEDIVRANLVAPPNGTVTAVLFSSKRIGEDNDSQGLAEFWEKGLADFRVEVTFRPRGLRPSPQLRSHWTAV